MKPTPTIKILPVILGLTSLIPVLQAKADAKPYKNFSLSVTDEEKKPAKKEKKEVSKTSNTKFALNNKVVKIYPDILKREMHVVAKESSAEKELDFFVFSTDGTLMQQHKMKPKEHKRITGLEKGRYVYRFFDGDEETATGKFEIR